MGGLDDARVQPFVTAIAERACPGPRPVPRARRPCRGEGTW
ncbi:hypothetical protein ACTMTI_39380 [Nonomuraea sp. H19]